MKDERIYNILLGNSVWEEATLEIKAYIGR
jgi:hypothetical protein